jgi:hypothetical protein
MFWKQETVTLPVRIPTKKKVIQSEDYSSMIIAFATWLT